MAAPARKLLIIDDDTIVRNSIVGYLEDSGYDVRDAENGPSGLAQFASFNPDLVLSDLKMPSMSGLDVLEEIHRLSPETPVIVISGFGVMGDVVEALRLGASDYLIKPIADMEVLEHAIRQSLERCELLEQNRIYRQQLEATNWELKENLRIFQRDQLAGRQVQERLLPPSPLERQGYSVSRQLYPSLYLSGDSVDYAFFKPKYLAFYLTDVSGHGAASAFITIWLKFLVRQWVRDQDVFADYEFESDAGPGTMLEWLNEEILSTKLNNHLTSFNAIINTESHKLRYAVGGHLPLPIMVTNNGAHYLEGKGRPIGIFKDTKWQVYEIDVPENGTIITFSDGVLEILPGTDLIAKEKLLLKKIDELGPIKDLEQICKALGLDDIAEKPDDIAVLMVRRGD